jgi:hypothetical protein
MPDIGPSFSTGKGPYRMQSANWKASLAVAVGDLVYTDSSDHYDKSAAQYTWDTNLATTQASFHDVFRGISQVRRTTAQTTDGSQTTDGPIACTGEFCMPCAALQSAIYPAYNTWVTIAQGTGNTLNPQKVVPTTDITLAIGKVTRPAAAGATWIWFEVAPAIGINNGLETVA